MGLARKTPLCVGDFARAPQLEGASGFDAAVAAARERLRPIVMTSLCFIHMVPPYFASGAGAEMRRSVGTAMLWGAFGVTLFGIFLTPVFFYVIRGLAGPVRKPAAVASEGSSQVHGMAAPVASAAADREHGA